MDKKFKIAIVGAGPAGMSAATHAAELGIPHILLEAAPHVANTISHFQKGKLVMAEPEVLPLRSTMSFGAGTREDILHAWQEDLAKYRVNLRTGAAVVSITGQRGEFRIVLASGERLDAEFVVLAIGLQGNIRKLGVLGENLPSVQYQLDDPGQFNNETIVVVGAGDAGVENALALAEQNRVILVNSQEEFTQCKVVNFDLLMSAVTKGRIETRVSTWTERIDSCTEAEFPLVFVAHTSQGLEHIKCHRIIARLGATPPRQLVESFGVHFPSSDLAAVPQLSEQYESNVPGLYIVGILAGYPLIKQAMNHGYEVIEYIQGNQVEPADEALLKEKFSGVPCIGSVSEGIELIRRTLPLFASLTTLQLREFMLDSSVHVLHQDEIIFERNDYCSNFYSVLQGSVSLQSAHKDGEVGYFRIEAGNFFGENALLSGRRRSGTAVAGEGCVLIETPRYSMLKLLHSMPEVRRRLDEVALKRIVQNSLDSSLSEHELEYLVRDAKLKQYAVGEALFNDGDQVDGLYLIRRGSVTVSRRFDGNEIVLAFVSAGNYVGEMALVSSRPRRSTLRAASPTDVVLLDAERVREVMERNSSLRGMVDSRYLGRISIDALPTDDAFSFNRLINFLMEHGVGEATDFLLIDYERCIRCDNCEKACADAHGGISRLDRVAGATYGQIQLPVSCRHCEHPHCMKDCPPHAIQRAVNGEVFISDSCIGCGNCQKNCPYGAIQMTVLNEFKQRDIWQVLSGTGASDQVENAGVSGLLRKAVKCDLCQGIRGGPLCVNTCPTGAAFRVSPEEFFSHVGSGNEFSGKERS